MAKEQEYYGKAFAASDRELNPAESAEEERYVKIGDRFLGQRLQRPPLR
jgi:hypothetical protein